VFLGPLGRPHLIKELDSKVTFCSRINLLSVQKTILRAGQECLRGSNVARVRAYFANPCLRVVTLKQNALRAERRMRTSQIP
jgi:hypothetical protein